MNCYVLYKTVKIFFFCQGPRRTADLLLSGPGSEMFGVLPDWASLQDQANLTLAIRINNIQHSSRFLSVLSCHCRFHFDSFISLNIYMYFCLLLFFTMYKILLELQSQAVEVYLMADNFFYWKWFQLLFHSHLKQKIVRFFYTRICCHFEML